MTEAMDNEFLIVQVYHPQRSGIGDFIYRIEQPSRAMGQIPGVKVVNANVYSPYLKELGQQADVLILHMVSEQDMLPLIEARKRSGLANVFEISDNFIAFQPRDPMRDFFNDPLNLATTFQYIHLADAIQAPSHGLADTFDFLNDSFVVFENQLMSMGKFDGQKDGTVTIGWAGSLSHLDDLEWIMPTFTDFCRKHSSVRFSYMGTREGFEYFGDIPDEQKSYIVTGSLYDYYRFLETIDIGIAPLLDTPYNRCRSDIKFVEYASRGVAPVLSALPPYEHAAIQGKTAFVFADEKELFNALEALAKNPDLRLSIARNAYDYVETHRQEGFHALKRVEYYNSLCGKRIQKSLPDNILDRISKNSQAYLVKETEEEKLTAKGFDSYKRGNVSGEWGFYKEAIKAAPAYYIPYLRLGDSLFRHGSAEAFSYLERASSASPDSLRSRLLSGLAFLELDKQSSCHHFEDALTISQLYAPAWDALGRVQEQLGEYGKAAGFFKLALKANPFYSLAVLGLARAFLAMGEKDEALRILRVADDILPSHTESRLHLAGLFLKIQQFQDAARQCEQILQQDPRNREARRLLRGIERDRYHSYAHMIEDFAEFSGLSIDDIEADIDRHHKLAADEWNRIDSHVFSVKACEFYKQSRYYIYDLLSGNCNRAAVIHKLNSFHPMLLKSILQHPGRDFLEFGGGVGLLCEIVLEMGKNVYYLDIPGQVFDFATWRFRKYDLPISVICSDPSNLTLERNFDIIFSDAVIEHVIDPKGVIDTLCHHINEGGLIILLVDLSGNSKQFPMHRNINIIEIQNMVRRNGFTNVAGDGTFCSIWKRTGRT